MEKALKAWLYYPNQDITFTHNGSLLLQLLQDCGLDVTAFLPLGTYADFAVQLRYDEDPERQNLDRAVCNADVTALITHVQELIGADQQRCFRAFQRLRQTLVKLVWLQHAREEHMGIEQQLLPVPHPAGCIEEGQVSSGRPACRAMAPVAPAPEWAVSTLGETPAAAECSIHA